MTWLPPQGAGHGVGSDLAVLGLEMDVDLAGDAFGGVTEGLADDLHRHPHGEQERAGCFMLELSHGHSMIGPVEAVVDAEIDSALFSSFGKPSDQRTVQVFGTGFGHAFGVGNVAAQLVDAEEGAAELDPAAFMSGYWRGHKRNSNA